MREKRNDNAYCIAWRTADGDEGNGDVYFTYDRAQSICDDLNSAHPFMYHYPMHYEESPDASEV